MPRLVQILPPEDVVAAFQGRKTRLFATTTTAADAQVYLEVPVQSFKILDCKQTDSRLRVLNLLNH